MSGCLVRVRGRTSFQRRWKKRVKEVGGDGEGAGGGGKEENVKKDESFAVKSNRAVGRKPKERRRKFKGTNEGTNEGPSEVRSLTSSYETPRIIISEPRRLRSGYTSRRKRER